MPVNPAYRDFFKAMDATARGEDPWLAYKRHYLGRHRALLRAYWSQCWALTQQQEIRAMVEQIRPQHYRALRSALRAAELESLAQATLRRCAALCELPEPQVDLLVGCFSPDAFLLQVARRWHIAIGLERFAHFSNLHLFIAHEYGHYARRMLAAQPLTLGARLVGEGAAVAFAQTAYPEAPLARHLRMSPRRIHEVRERERDLWAALAPHLEAADADGFAGVLYGAQRWMGFPPRFGVCLGYWAVRHYAAAGGASPAAPAVLGAPAGEILIAYLDAISSARP